MAQSTWPRRRSVSSQPPARPSAWRWVSGFATACSHTPRICCPRTLSTSLQGCLERGFTPGPAEATANPATRALVPLATQATNIQRTQQSVQSVLTGLLGEDAPLSVPIAVREISEEPMIPQVLRAATPLVPLSRTRPPSPRARASPQNCSGYSQPPSCAALKARTDELAGAKRLVAAGPADQARDAAHAVFPRAPAAAALSPVAALPRPQPGHSSTRRRPAAPSGVSLLTRCAASRVLRRASP